MREAGHQGDIEQNRAEIRRIQREVQSLPVLDDRTPDEIIGYDEHGLPS
jgi:antitoxin VapB